MIKNLHIFTSTEKTMHLRIAQKCGRVKHLFIGLWLWCLTSLSTIFQLYGGGQFYWQGKLEYPEKTTDLPKSLTRRV
jgi:hypothetical protein